MNIRTVLAFVGVVLAIALCLNPSLKWSPWVLASAAITAFILLLVRLDMIPTPTIQAIGVMALLYWGLSFISNLIEAAFFNVLPLNVAMKGAAGSAITVVIAVWVLEWLVPKKPTHVLRSFTMASGQWWRIPLLCLCFFLIYVTAGAAIYPWIKSFYADKPLPNLQQLFLLQCARGLLDLACVYPWLHRCGGTRTKVALLSAGIFTILCGWGPLLLPNQYLPPSIRLAHAIEMGASGIVFGILTAFLLLKPAHLAGATPESPTAVANA